MTLNYTDYQVHALYAHFLTYRDIFTSNIVYICNLYGVGKNNEHFCHN